MRRLLIVGCGDIALRTMPLLRRRDRLYAPTRTAERPAPRRAMGITPLCGDLDDADSLSRLSGLPHDVLHFAPPPRSGERDWRTGNLMRALRKARSIPQGLVGISTSGVYGDCGGRVVWRPQRELRLRLRYASVGQVLAEAAHTTGRRG